MTKACFEGQLIDQLNNTMETARRWCAFVPVSVPHRASILKYRYSGLLDAFKKVLDEDRYFDLMAFSEIELKEWGANGCQGIIGLQSLF